MKVKVIPANSTSLHYPGQIDKKVPVEGIVVERDPYWDYCTSRGYCSMETISKSEHDQEKKPDQGHVHKEHDHRKGKR